MTEEGASTDVVRDVRDVRDVVRDVRDIRDVVRDVMNRL